MSHLSLQTALKIMVDAVQITDALVRAIFAVDDQPGNGMALVALSDNLTPEEALAWQGFAVVEPLAHPSFLESQAVGIFAGLERNFLFVRTHNQLEDQHRPVYEYILLPREVLQQMAGSLGALLSLTETPIRYTKKMTQCRLKP